MNKPTSVTWVLKETRNNSERMAWKERDKNKWTGVKKVKSNNSSKNKCSNPITITQLNMQS